MNLFHEVQKGLKPNIASRLVKIKVCMPIYIFIDFFAIGDSPIDLNNTMLVCKNIDCNTILKFLDRGWDFKVLNVSHTHTQNRTVCTLSCFVCVCERERGRLSVKASIFVISINWKAVGLYIKTRMRKWRI